MKFRTLLLLSAVVISGVSCQSEIEYPKLDVEEGVISLQSGATISRVGNQGVRNVFESGDQIGVVSVFAAQQANLGDPIVPKWDTVVHFENKPAAFFANSSAPVITTFGWGLNAEGGKLNNQYYPAQKKQVFLYSYYPYSATAGVYEPLNSAAATDAERQPKLNVELVSGVIDGSAASVLTKQPDVLYYVPTNPVSSASPTPPFVYNHALAQIRFVVKRATGAKNCTFKNIVFKSTAKGKLNLADGKFTIDPDADRQEAVYTISLPANTDSTALIIPESDPNTNLPSPLDVLNPSGAANFNYLMVLPLTKEDAEKGELILTCNFGEVTNPAKEDLGEFRVKLTDRLVNFEPGKLNTLTITVSYFGVSVTASITPWGTGSNVELPAE